jgi:hypothetical protein
MATRTEETIGDVTVVYAEYDTGLSEVTVYTPSTVPGLRRELRAVIENMPGNPWILLSDHGPTHDRYFRTRRGATAAAVRLALALHARAAGLQAA